MHGPCILSPTLFRHIMWVTELALTLVSKEEHPVAHRAKASERRLTSLLRGSARMTDARVKLSHGELSRDSVKRTFTEIASTSPRGYASTAWMLSGKINVTLLCRDVSFLLRIANVIHISSYCRTDGTFTDGKIRDCSIDSLVT